MKRFILWLMIGIFFFGLSIVPAVAENYPAYHPTYKQYQPLPPAKTHPPKYYGYVPPPPIRHTWPGGYKVIFHEMMNTYIEHMLGKY